MIESMQVQNTNAQYVIKNSTIQESGKVRILAFDVKHNIGIPRDTEIVLCHVPSGMVRLISLVFQYPSIANLGEDNIEANFYLRDKNINVLPDIYLKTLKLNAGSSGEESSLLNYPYSSIYGDEIIVKINSDILANQEIKGYILYVMD